MFRAHFAGCHGLLSCRCETKRYRIVLFINLTVCFVEVYGGKVVNILALVSDGLHVFTDTTNVSLALLVQMLVARSGGRQEARVRAWGGVGSAVLLLGLASFLGVEALRRLLHPEPLLSLPMAGLALVGLLGNGLALVLLAAGEDDHLTHRSLLLHVASDTLVSVLVLIGAMIVFLSGQTQVDPIISLCGIAVIGFWGTRLFFQSVDELLF